MAPTSASGVTVTTTSHVVNGKTVRITVRYVSAYQIHTTRMTAGMSSALPSSMAW